MHGEDEKGFIIINVVFQVEIFFSGSSFFWLRM